MINKSNVGVVFALIVSIGAFGVFESLQAAPKESQHLRGMEGRAFLVEAFALDEDGNVIGPNPPGGSYCYIFNSNAEWIDERFPVPGTWEQHSVGAKTPYSAAADLEIEPLVVVVLAQEGRVTPAQGSGVLQLEAITDIFIDIFDEDGNVIQRILFGSLLAVGHEIDVNDCPPPFPPEE